MRRPGANRPSSGRESSGRESSGREWSGRESPYGLVGRPSLVRGDAAQLGGGTGVPPPESRPLDARQRAHGFDTFRALRVEQVSERAQISK
jgi:hypothetical protein